MNYTNVYTAPPGRDLTLACRLPYKIYHLIHGRRRSAGGVACTGVRLITLECTRWVNNPLYHCRHSAGDRQSKCDS